MKLRFNREEMADALGAVCAVTGARTPKEILRSVLLDAQSDVLLLAATDQEIGVRVAVTQVEVGKTGTALVVADTLNRIVRECNDELLAIELSGTTLHVRGEGSHFQVVTQTVDDFPPVPTMQGEPDFTLDVGTLRRLIEWTSFAAARESSRYAINGILWEIDGDKLTMAATDGRRLSIATTDISGKGSGKASGKTESIVPTKALNLLARIAADADAQVGVKLTSNQVMFKIGGAFVSSMLVEGHFPKYQDVIPSDCNKVVRIQTDAFHGALKRAALLTNEESKGVRLSLESGTMTLSSRAPEQGEATISIPVTYEGESMEIGFNPVFLTDVLRVTHEDEVNFALKESSRPGLIEVGNFRHVVMPVNLTSA